MFFQRFSATSAVRSASKSFLLTGAGAVCVLLLILTANNAVFAQNYPFRADGGRRAWNVPTTGIPSRVEPSETPTARNRTAPAPGVGVGVATNRVEAGIPSRLEGTNATAVQNSPQRPDVRETESQETGWAVSGSSARGGSGQNGRNEGDARNAQNTQNGRNEQVGQNGTTRGGTAPGVCVSLPFARKATREELERWRASEKGTLVAIPRANFLRNPKEEGAATDAAPTGIDAATETVATRDAVEAPSTESVASPIAATVPSAPTVGDDEFIVFTLSNLPPDEAALLRDAEDGRWDEIDLFDAALIAEGLTARERRAPQREKFERFAAELATLTERETDPLEKTKIVYGYLHDVVLTEKYNLNCSSLVASLETGVFNCVSATALFNCFAARSGLEVAALETTGHAKSRVKFADSFLDLETTCSSWDRLPDKMRAYSRPRRAAVGENENGSETTATLQNVSFERGGLSDDVVDAGTTTFDAETSTPDAPLGYSYTRTRKPMREIGDVELVATIYYNVGVDFYQKERFEEAIVAYVKAARLAPNNPTILGNLKATLNNWAIQIAMKERDFERAIQVAEQGLLLDPNFPEYKMNLPIFFHRWVDCLALENRWDEAKRVEREYLKRFPKPTPQ